MNYNRKEKELENSNPCEVFFLFCIYWLLTVLSDDGILQLEVDCGIFPVLDFFFLYIFSRLLFLNYIILEYV